MSHCFATRGRWLALLLLAACPAVLPAADLKPPAGCCYVECPRCRHVCRLEVRKGEVDRHCWQVRCEPICVPRVTLPWFHDCQPRCAWVRTVKVLHRHEYQCERCEYEWTPVRCGPCRGACGETAPHR